MAQISVNNINHETIIAGNVKQKENGGSSAVRKFSERKKQNGRTRFGRRLLIFEITRLLIK
jgi:hypothetical protein